MSAKIVGWCECRARNHKHDFFGFPYACKVSVWDRELPLVTNASGEKVQMKWCRRCSDLYEAGYR